MTPLERLLFVDCEASGLHQASYPIEVGWSDYGLKTHAFLIRPHDDWGQEDWSWESEKVHGILQLDCLRHGVEVRDAARRINAAFDGRRVFSDAPAWETKWLDRLFDAAEVTPCFEVESWDHLILSACEREGIPFERGYEIAAAVEEAFPHTHRADADARSLAAAFRAIIDPGFLDSISTRIPVGTG